MDEDFELTIQANRLSKPQTQKKLASIENIPNTGEIQEELTINGKDDFITKDFAEKEEKPTPSITCSEKGMDLSGNPYSDFPCFNTLKDDQNSDNDSAQGSLSSEEKYDGGKYKHDLRPGMIIWGALTRYEWYPCIIDQEEADKKGHIIVKWFNYRGKLGVVPATRTFPFGTIDDFWNEITKVRKLSRRQLKKFTSITFRAIEEARIFTNFKEELRLQVFNTIIDLQSGPPNKRVVTVDVDCMSSKVPSHLKEDVKKYVEELKVYDHKVKESVEKKNQMKTLNAETKKKVEEVATESVKESAVDSTKCRHSTRVITKRKLSIDSTVSRESNPTDALEPAPKKPRIKQNSIENIPFEVRFQYCPKDVIALFKNVSSQPISVECCSQKEGMETYKCTGCNSYYHEECSFDREITKKTTRHKTGDADIIFEQKIVKVKCKSCATGEKLCFLCFEVIEGEEDLFSCNLTDCGKNYHKTCLDKSPQSNLKKQNSHYSCPQHHCHTCLLKKCNRVASLVKVTFVRLNECFN